MLVELGVLDVLIQVKTEQIHITLQVAEQCIQKRALRYDKGQETTITILVSAFIKSMRGSDPDAALYYLAKMLYAGESVEFIARRIMISCGGGCGTVPDPTGVSSCNVLRQMPSTRVGMPEAQIILAEAVVYTWQLHRKATRHAYAI